MGEALTRALYLLGIMLFHARLDGVVRWLGRGNVKVLLYHDIEAAESDYVRDLDCTTPPARFAAHLDWLARHYSVVGLDVFLAGKAPPRAVVITFDDGYNSVYRNGFPVLRARDAGDAVSDRGCGREPHDGVGERAELLAARGADTRARRAARHDGRARRGRRRRSRVILPHPVRRGAHRGRAGGIARGLPAHAAEGIDAAQLYVDWDEVREMGANGFTFGNHTRSHPNLERLTDAAQFAEIAGAQQAIAREIGPVTSLAYPFGHHARSTATIAARAGLTSCGEVGGANREVAAMAVGRTHIADEDIAGLFARMEVVEPVKARLRALSALRSRSDR